LGSSFSIQILEIIMAAKSKSRGRSRKESPNGTELLVLELQGIYSAESQLSRVLPRLIQAASSEPLRSMLERRLDDGGRLVKEIESAFEKMDESPGRKKNGAAEGLISDAREHVQEISEGPALDTVLIAAIQKTEHYCIAAWGTARSLAQATGQKDVVQAMERVLREGKALDERLTELAERDITPALLAEEPDERLEEGDGQRRSRSNTGSERRTSN
jgi:ferritin-like metal-binding protein YciE